MKKFIFLILQMASMIATGQQIVDLRRHFDYDRSADLDIHVLYKTDSLNAFIQKLQYSGGNGLTVTAYLVLPHKNLRQFPAIIFLHENGKNKSEFLSEAIQLTGDSYASLLIDAPCARLQTQQFVTEDYSTPRKEAQLIIQTILDIRRGIDLLQDNENIDRDRIGFVGIGSSAVSGAILAGVENRILTYVLLGCDPCISCELQSSKDPQMIRVRNNLTEEQITYYKTMMQYYDPIHYIGFHRSSSILYQFAISDVNLNSEKIKILEEATSSPFFQSSYPGIYSDMLSGNAMKDREVWFKDHL